MQPELCGFKVLTFDVYGTLIDWETGMIEALRPLTDRLRRTPGRDGILETHAFHESTAQRWTPTRLYRDLLPVVYRRLAKDWGVTVNWDECVAYGRSVGDWPAFPDSADALAWLKAHFRLAVLTNTDNVSFTASEARFGVEFDADFTAEDIGSYKPDPRNFEYMIAGLRRTGIDSSPVLHVAESLFTTMFRPAPRASPTTGSTGATTRRASAPPCPRRRLPIATSGSTAWPNWRTPIVGNSISGAAKGDDIPGLWAAQQPHRYNGCANQRGGSNPVSQRVRRCLLTNAVQPMAAIRCLKTSIGGDPSLLPETTLILATASCPSPSGAVMIPITKNAVRTVFRIIHVMTFAVSASWTSRNPATLLPIHE